MLDGKDILKTLIELYASQEQIIIKYELAERSTNKNLKMK